jgi:hypothetical protein
MNELQQELWITKEFGDLLVKPCYQFFHGHAKEVLNYHDSYLLKFQEVLNDKIPIKPIIRTKSNKKVGGIEANDLNTQIRVLLSNGFADMKFEVQEEHGVYYFSTKEKKQVAGFDFALINNLENLQNLRELCFGNLRYNDGEERWRKFLYRNPNLQNIASVVESGIPSNKQDLPLVLGEIQFGNWALAYRDLFKTLKANVQTSVDCLIYIVPAGNLEELLSDGIVTYNKMKVILEDFAKVINVPVWLLGLDIKI